jgi:ADP-heptose:LPS heptosyltransferase
LGDIVLSLPAMRAIRAFHPNARITLQTTPPWAGFLRASPYADDVSDDGRPRGVLAGLALARRVRRARYELVYDLQNSERTALLFWLLQPGAPAWNGTAPGASHCKPALRGPLKKHAVERFAELMALTGIPAESAQTIPDVSWAIPLGKSPAAFGLDGPFLMIAAAASAGRSVKRWPSDRFAAMARLAAGEGLTPVFVGAARERAALDEIVGAVPGARNLAGDTTLFDLASLAAGARGAIGNDTGPVFLAAAAGAPTLVLYSRHSLHPDLCAPRGPGGVLPVRRHELSEIEVGDAADGLMRLGVLRGGAT